MSKRIRDSSLRDTHEEYASLFRQHCNRVLIRFDRTKRVEGVDQLILMYALFYLNPNALPRASIVAQAQLPLTSTVGRVSHPDVFAWSPLSSVLDQLADDMNSDAILTAVKDLEELADGREELGEQLSNSERGADADDDEEHTAASELEELVGSGVFWSLCASYLECRCAMDAQQCNLESFHKTEVEALVSSLPDEELSAVAGDVSALLGCPVDRIAYHGNTAECGQSVHHGIDRDVFALVRCIARHRWILKQVRSFEKRHRRQAPELTAEQLAMIQRMEEAAVLANATSTMGGGDMGVGLDFVPDDQYLTDTAAKDNEAPLQEDENFFKDEVHDYYLRRNAGARTGAQPPHHHQQQGGHRQQHVQPQQLVKPNRYCKVKTGYNWTQYNKTHYTRSNPPPKTVMWYEFTLFYPLLIQNKKVNWGRIYRIEDVEQGFNDEFCLLVFAPGPPYADVAYRIVRRQWDTRPGAVRCSFDAKGKFRLFFKFSNSNYKR